MGLYEARGNEPLVTGLAHCFTTNHKGNLFQETQLCEYDSSQKACIM